MNDSSSRDLAIFAEAVQLSADERSAYLERACGTDEELGRRLERLLKAHDQVGDFLEQPPPEAVPGGGSEISVGEKPGDRIGRYKLLQQIGEGGCGVVYMAEQEQPVRRRVALKIIKAGMDTKSVIARFEAERQALALMDHPNIAKVFDAGATELRTTAMTNRSARRNGSNFSCRFAERSNTPIKRESSTGTSSLPTSW
jgi:eukaryotic-like serine/threonine-protein kinase